MGETRASSQENKPSAREDARQAGPQRSGGQQRRRQQPQTACVETRAIGATM